MKITLTVEVEIETEASPSEREAAERDAIYETEKALDYWFSHTDRSMTARTVSLRRRVAR